jgi:hypothetical protein
MLDAFSADRATCWHKSIRKLPTPIELLMDVDAV